METSKSIAVVFLAMAMQ